MISDLVLHEKCANPEHGQGEINTSSWPALKAGMIRIFTASVSLFKKNKSDALSNLFLIYFVAVGICTRILLASGSPDNAEM